MAQDYPLPYVDREKLPIDVLAKVLLGLAAGFLLAAIFVHTFVVHTVTYQTQLLHSVAVIEQKSREIWLFFSWIVVGFLGGALWPWVLRRYEVRCGRVIFLLVVLFLPSLNLFVRGSLAFKEFQFRYWVYAFFALIVAHVLSLRRGRP